MGYERWNINGTFDDPGAVGIPVTNTNSRAVPGLKIEIRGTHHCGSIEFVKGKGKGNRGFFVPFTTFRVSEDDSAVTLRDEACARMGHPKFTSS